MEKEYIERLVKAEESTKSAHHRIDGVVEQNKAIMELAVSVGRIADKTDAIDCKVDKVITAQETDTKRIDTLERAPGDLLIGWAKLAAGAAITGGVGIAIGVMLG